MLKSEIHINFDGFSDEELIDLYLSEDDIRYFSVLYLRYNHLIFGVCMKYLKNIEDSKDMVMDLYEKVRINNEMSFPTLVLSLDWLYLVDIAEINEYGEVLLCI